MFWDCFSYKITGALVPIQDMLNSQKYEDLLHQKLESALRKVEAKGSEDSAPYHVSKDITK